MIFTKTDKTLLDRAARIIHNQAVVEENSYKGDTWAATETGKEAKKRYDRLLRDERDLRALAKRLEKAMPAAVYPEHSAATRLATGAGDPPYTAPGSAKDDGLHPGSALS